MEDSFIDDTDDVLQEFLYSTYSREIRTNNGNIVDIVISDHGDDDDDDDHSEEEEEYDMDSSSEEIVVQRDEPYTLRDSHRSLPDSSRTTTNSLDRYICKTKSRVIESQTIWVFFSMTYKLL